MVYELMYTAHFNYVVERPRPLEIIIIRLTFAGSKTNDDVNIFSSSMKSALPAL